MRLGLSEGRRPRRRGRGRRWSPRRRGCPPRAPWRPTRPPPASAAAVAGVVQEIVHLPNALYANPLHAPPCE